MNYKKIILPLFLTTSLVYGVRDKEVVRQELLQKHEQLSQLSTKIAKKVKIISKVGEEVGKYSHNQETPEIINSFMPRYFKARDTDGIKGFLIEEFYNKDPKLKNDIFNIESAKILCLRAVLEYHYLRLLIEEYETCLAEVITIDKEYYSLEG